MEKSMNVFDSTYGKERAAGLSPRGVSDFHRTQVGVEVVPRRARAGNVNQDYSRGERGNSAAHRVSAWMTFAGCLLSGCARPAGSFFTRSEQRLVWPPPPEKPRVEYLGEFAAAVRAPGDRSAAKSWNELFYGPEKPPSLVTPHAVSMNADGTALAVADPNANCVHLLDLERQTYRRIDGIPSAKILLRCPVGVAWSGDSILIIDSELHAIVRIERAASVDEKQGNVTGGYFATVSDATLQRPAGIACNPANDEVYVTDSATHRVCVFDRSGAMTRTFGEHGGGEGQFNFPSQIAVAPDGSIVVADSMNFRIQRFSADGAFLGAFGEKGDAAGDFALPKGVAVDARGSIWVVDAQFENVQAFDTDGRLLIAVGGEGHEPGQFWLPAGAAIDSKQRLWIADSYNRRVQGFQLLP